MLSGDSEEAVAATAHDLGIETYRASMLPALFVPYAEPLDLALPDGIAQRVQRVADQAEDLLYLLVQQDSPAR